MSIGQKNKNMEPGDKNLKSELITWLSKNKGL
jgi:hypothetical protein